MKIMVEVAAQKQTKSRNRTNTVDYFQKWCQRTLSTLSSIPKLLPEESEVFFVLLKLVPFAIYGYITAFVKLFVPSRLTKRKSITGHTILITGAGSGIGRHLAIEMSKHSTHLVLLDLNLTPLRHTAKMLDECSTYNLYECDVSDRDRVYEVAKLVKTEVGKVDILVNNAGVVSGQLFLDLDDQDIERTFRVNTLGHFWMCKAFLPEMISGNSGHVVCIASMAGLQGFPRLADYSGSKFGAVGFMEALGVECQRQKLDGLKFTTVCPSFATTGLFEGMSPPLKVNMTPEYVAKKVVEAVEEEKDLVMIPSWTYIIILLKWTMPSYANKRFFENSGLLTFMDNFKGRSSNNNVKVTTSGEIQ